jgi:AmmeMemoRadiSam system protein A
LQRSVVIIASGDLSHRLKKDGPYGFNPAGPKYDARIMEVMSKGDFLELLVFPPSLCEEAGECGHRSFTIMAGALDKMAVNSQKLSYEGPFGVGYGVVEFAPMGADLGRNFLEQYPRYRDRLLAEKKKSEDPYVHLARAALELYIEHGKTITTPQGVPGEMLATRAGVFVSLKKDGTLRGCIGTIGPVRDSLAKEIIFNAISAGTQDPRFLEVKPTELAELEYSVDVLGPLEAISSPRELDVKRYGVIVTKGSRTGLLLPNLEGIDTIEQQIDIAKQKAGIRQEETGVSLQRFEVIRHK